MTEEPSFLRDSFFQGCIRRKVCLHPSRVPLLKMLTASIEYVGRYVWIWLPSTAFLKIAPPPYPHRCHIWIGPGSASNTSWTQFSWRNLKYEISVFSCSQAVLLNGRGVNVATFDGGHYSPWWITRQRKMVCKEDKWYQWQGEVDSRYGVLGWTNYCKKRSQISVTSHNTSLSLAHTKSNTNDWAAPPCSSLQVVTRGPRILSYHLMSPQCCGFKIPWASSYPIPARGPFCFQD